MSYEVIKAKTYSEALAKSSYQVGEVVRVSELSAIANGNGTWSVSPIIEKLQEVLMSTGLKSMEVKPVHDIKPATQLVAGLPKPVSNK